MTFSITARCERTGMFGISVSSSSICVAARCGTWVRAGVGAVATQNITDPRLGDLGLRDGRRDLDHGLVDEKDRALGHRADGACETQPAQSLQEPVVEHTPGP